MRVAPAPLSGYPAKDRYNTVLCAFWKQWNARPASQLLKNTQHKGTERCRAAVLLLLQLLCLLLSTWCLPHPLVEVSETWPHSPAYTRPHTPGG